MHMKLTMCAEFTVIPTICVSSWFTLMGHTCRGRMAWFSKSHSLAARKALPCGLGRRMHVSFKHASSDAPLYQSDTSEYMEHISDCTDAWKLWYSGIPDLHNQSHFLLDSHSQFHTQCYDISHPVISHSGSSRSSSLKLACKARCLKISSRL